MSKKTLIVISLVIVIAGTAVYLYQNYRGAAPAVLRPNRDITEELPSSTDENGNPGTPVPAGDTNSPLAVPSGFGISIFAKNLPGARVLTWDENGFLLVSLTGSGKIVAVDSRGGQKTVVSGLREPHGMVLKCENHSCKLYVGETHQVSVFDYDSKNKTVSNKKKIADLPASGRHYTRTLMDYDGKLLVSVGSSCDVCFEEDSRRASILSMNYDGSNVETFASGLRNSVFMTRSYVDGRIWATEMGRDNLGDNLPPDEINIIEKGGSSTSSGQNPIPDFGWPICYGQGIHDAQFDTRKYIIDPCTDKVSSTVDLQAHSAPLGLAFVPEEGWPEDYWYDLLVAYHGSWNRTEPTGFKVVRIKLDEKGNYSGTEDFITGWLPKGAATALGRPVDILTQPGGTMFISDDKAGVIYKVGRR